MAASAADPLVSGKNDDGQPNYAVGLAAASELCGSRKASSFLSLGGRQCSGSMPEQNRGHAKVVLSTPARLDSPMRRAPQPYVPTRPT